MSGDLFDALCLRVGAGPTRHGEVHLACPKCGHLSSPHAPHCSFSRRGWHCFVCGAGGSLQSLAELVKLSDASRYAPAPVARRSDPKPPAWLGLAETLIGQYERHPQRLELWRKYKHIDPATILRLRLGVGVLPLSKCHHERLVVPIFDGTMCVGLRGRRLGCDCPKWLAPGGTLISLYPLYNQAALFPGCRVVVLENPIDALLLTQAVPGVIGVATYSVSYWQERWTEALRAVGPGRIEIAYDNDEPGRMAGTKLANRLQQAGLSQTFYWRWPKETPAHYDVGNMLEAAYA